MQFKFYSRYFKNVAPISTKLLICPFEICYIYKHHTLNYATVVHGSKDKEVNWGAMVLQFVYYETYDALFLLYATVEKKTSFLNPVLTM